MKNWFFRHDGVRHGPFTADELRLKAAIGELRPTDLVWRADMSQPVEARLVPTLFDLPESTDSSRQGLSSPSGENDD
jgi:hypothetical protein